MSRKKACAIILRKKKEIREILVFRHPDGSVQFVKGNLKPNEKPKNAAIRELKEESGISKLDSAKLIGAWNSKFRKQVWYFFRCKPTKELNDAWTFHTKDDGGADFEFFWVNLEDKPGKDWSPVFKRALKYLRLHV